MTKKVGGPKPKIKDETIKRDLEEGLGVVDIARKHSMSKGQISSRIKKMGVSVRNKLTETSEYGNRLASIPASELEAADVDPEKDLYYERTVEDGKVILEIYEERVPEGENR